MKPAEPEETRAEIARRRLAQLTASFDHRLPPPDDEVDAPRARAEIPYVRALTAVAVAAGLLLVCWLLAARPEASDPTEPLAFATTAAPDPSVAGTAAAAPGTAVPAAQKLIIDVVGKVRRPGIVEVPKGSRVFEAIDAAGGLKGRVDTATLNLARELSDGEQIVVGVAPVAVGGSVPAPGAAGAVPPGTGGAPIRVNLNTATAEQLDALPGVGPVTAQAILSWREQNGRFAAVDDLLDVKGIGEATLAELRDLVVV